LRKDRAEEPSTSERPIRRLAGPAVHLASLSKNPLAIALVVALLGNFLIPRILDRAETNRRALDLKASLATQMGSSFAAALTLGELTARDVIRKTNLDPQAVFNDGLSEWNNASAEVDAQLLAYFGGAQEFYKRWGRYKRAVSAMYVLSGTGLKGRRCTLIRDVASFLDPGKPAPVERPCGKPSFLNEQKNQETFCHGGITQDYDLLAACDGNDEAVSTYERGATFSDAYTRFSQRLLDRGGTLVRELVSLTPSGY
jgi:hypothetical protein